MGVLPVLAFACGSSGTPILTIDVRPVSDPNGASVTGSGSFVLYASGAWRRTETRSNQRLPGDPVVRLDVEEGCLDPARMKALAPSLARATFTAHLPRVTCRAMPSERVTYASPARGRTVEIYVPCREVLDPGTQTAAACVDAITDWSLGPDDYTPICLGEEP